MFREKELSSPELKKLIFQEWTIQAQKIKKKNHSEKFIIFREMDFPAPNLESSYIFSEKFFSYISRGNLQNLKTKSF